MPDLEHILDQIAADRAADPLSIVTVIAPSRLAALQLRRRLARRGAFAGVRFETAARLAELIAASTLAREKRRPLARPIADYVATVVAKESQPPLHLVRDLPGYARALRQTFRRLRRGGLRDGDDLLAPGSSFESLRMGAADASMREIARLYSLFRSRTARFYDDEDLMETAARVITENPATVLPELGTVYVIPPVRMSAGASALLDAIAAVAPFYVEVEDGAAAAPDQRYILAPDAASEGRSVVRSIIQDLEDGVPQDEIAVFLSGDRGYRSLMRQVFEAAEIPDASMPGTPLIELPAGRGALALAKLALEDYSRLALFDFMDLAPLRDVVPAGASEVPLTVTQWQRIARDAGVTHGLQRWRHGIDIYIADRQGVVDDEDRPEWRRRTAGSEAESAGRLREVVEALAAALQPLVQRQPAASFIPSFRGLIEGWFDPRAEGLQEVLREVGQLGTIDSVQGEFSLSSFVEAFEANLSLAAVRRRSIDRGILIADHRQAAGLRFQRVYLCGAYEGALPVSTMSEPLIQEEDWARLRESYPYIEDLELRSERSRQAVDRVIASAGFRLTWSAPTAAATAARDYYPSALMTRAASERDAAIVSASDLRAASLEGRDWLSRTPSPLSALLTGPAVDRWEGRLRESIGFKKAGGFILPSHPLHPPVEMIRERRSNRFTTYDGYIGELGALAVPSRSISPSALETFAGCGLRYFFGNVLYLRAPEEPEENQTMGAADKGTLIHAVLQRFFAEAQASGRPALGERWGDADTLQLHEIFEEEYERFRQQGRAGLDIYMDQDRRVMRADLATFLERDSDFRIQEGVLPYRFEMQLPSTPVGDISVHGYIDRIDRSPDGKKVVIFDYKTGKPKDYRADDPFAGGTAMQLPVYTLVAADAEDVRAAYWYITSRGGFDRGYQYQATPELQQRFEATVGAVLDAVRAGAFPAVPGDEDEFYGKPANCRFCDFDSICSRRRVPESQFKAGDPDIAAWFNVATVAKGGQP